MTAPHARGTGHGFGLTIAPGLIALVVALLAAALVGTAGPAGAGGAHWVVERDGYRPGELVDARSGVAWGHNPMLGQPEEAPYHAYLRRLGPDGYVDDGTDLAARVARATYVGDVQIVFAPIPMKPDGTGIRFGPNGAILRFVLPDLAPGRYSILHCGTPCRTYLGDLMGGTLTVLEPDGSYPPDATTTLVPPIPSDPTPVPATAPATSAAPTTTAATTTTSATVGTAPVEAGALAAAPTAAGGGRLPSPGGTTTELVVVLAIGAAAGAGGWIRHRRRRPPAVSQDRRD